MGISTPRRRFGGGCSELAASESKDRFVRDIGIDGPGVRCVFGTSGEDRMSSLDERGTKAGAAKAPLAALEGSRGDDRSSVEPATLLLC